MARRNSEAEVVADDSNTVYEVSRLTRSDLTYSSVPTEPESTVLDSEIVFGSCRRRLEAMKLEESEEESEIVFCTDQKRLDGASRSPVGNQDSSTSLEKVKKFFCHSTKEFLEKASEMKSGNFLLFPTEGRVQNVTDLQKEQKESFVIGFRSFCGEIVRFDVAERNLKGVKKYFVQSLDSESPSFSSLYALVAFYADNLLYFSIRFQRFVRFPVGQVMKREDLMRVL